MQDGRRGTPASASFPNSRRVNISMLLGCLSRPLHSVAIERKTPTRLLAIGAPCFTPFSPAMGDAVRYPSVLQYPVDLAHCPAPIRTRTGPATCTVLGVLIVVRHAESGAARQRPRRRSGCRSRRTAGCVVVAGSRRARQVHRRVAPGDARLVRRVEHVDAQLDVPAAAQPDVPRDGQIEHAREAAVQVAVARLEPDAADQRPLERRRVELPVQVAAAARAGIADDRGCARRSRASRSGSRCRRRSGS